MRTLRTRWMQRVRKVRSAELGFFLCVYEPELPLCFNPVGNKRLSVYPPQRESFFDSDNIYMITVQLPPTTQPCSLFLPVSLVKVWVAQRLYSVAGMRKHNIVRGKKLFQPEKLL